MRWDGWEEMCPIGQEPTAPGWALLLVLACWPLRQLGVPGASGKCLSWLGGSLFLCLHACMHAWKISVALVGIVSGMYSLLVRALLLTYSVGCSWTQHNKEAAATQICSPCFISHKAGPPSSASCVCQSLCSTLHQMLHCLACSQGGGLSLLFFA
jgi:hypothetical protein